MLGDSHRWLENQQVEKQDFQAENSGFLD